MPEWRNVVQERLAGLALEENNAAQVFDELTNHLEESYQSLLDAGLSERGDRLLRRANDRLVVIE